MPEAGLPDFAPDLIRSLHALGAGRVQIPMLQPAEPFLDMAGEDLRRRIFMTESETGESLCLRPEFTIPVCRAHIADTVDTPRRYSYLGQVFRQRREGESEFFQAGVEDLGEPDQARADARAISEAHALVAQFTSGHPLKVILGDQAVFEAVVAGLGLPAGWQKRLIHAFGNESALSAMIARLANPEAPALPDASVADYLKNGDAAGLEAHIETVMQATGYSTNASRSPKEITARLMDKQALDATRLSPEALQALKAFLALNMPLDQAASALSSFAQRAGLDISTAQANFEARLAALAERGEDLGTIEWHAAFGRPLDYYTGMVFEIVEGKNAQVLAGGGRYDRMMALLGAQDPIPAVGFSLWVDRIETVRANR